MAAKKPAVDNGVIASLGKQLTNKVDNGKLTIDQATKVKGQRNLLAKAFGPDWRVKFYGKGGAKSYPTFGYKGDTELNDVRAHALKRAKAKLATGTDTTTLNGGTVAPSPAWKNKKQR